VTSGCCCHWLRLHLQVKVWSLASGFCFVTFTDHAAPVTGVAWLPSGNAVLSCSLVRIQNTAHASCIYSGTQASSTYDLGCPAVPC
jgi:WD40 repeat protein